MSYVERSYYIKLGIFLLVAFILFIIALITLAGLKIWEKRDRYKIVFRESVAGLEIGAPVKLQGVRVGRVDSIELNPENVEEVIVTISLRKGTPIKEDAVATVKPQGITGLRFIEISKGTKYSRLLEPGETIKSGRSELDELTGAATDIAAQVQLLLSRFLKLTEGENWNKINHIITKIDDLLTNLDRLTLNLILILQENRSPLNYTLKNLALTTKETKESVKEIRESINRLAQSLDITLEETRKTFKAVRKLSNRGEKTFKELSGTVSVIRAQVDKARLKRVMDSLVKVMEALSKTTSELERTLALSKKDIKKTLRSIRNASEMIQEFARNLRDNPSILLDSDGLPEREK